YKISVVLGHEKYYPKFGYEIASKLDIKSPFDVPNENFMALNLNNEKLDITGIVEYAKEFFE
ncbi:MAG: N-acetyltransferase, partial [Eubacteriales bacterium]|nr:N-acetyltransferase [Eubacteriales bacterium]